MTSQREVNDGRGGPSSRGRGGTAIRPDPVFFLFLYAEMNM